MNPRIKELCEEFKDLKTDYEKYEEILEKINVKWNECEAELMAAMIDEGVNSLDLDEIGKFSLSSTNYLSVNAGNKEQFYEYLKESGNGGLLKLDVNPKTLTAFLGKHLEELKSTVVSTEGLDEIEARDKVLEMLKSKGANYFTKRSIKLKGAKNG